MTIAGILEKVKTLATPTGTTDDASTVKSVAFKQRQNADARAAEKDAQQRRRSELADVFAELDARHSAARDTVSPKTAKAMERASQLTQLIDASERSLAKLDAEAEELSAVQADLTSRITKAQRAQAEAHALDKYFEAAICADEKMEQAVLAAEAADAANEHYRASVLANGGAPPTPLPLGCILSTFWCVAPMMRKLGTSFTLSLSTSAASGRLRFFDCVKCLRKDDES